MTPDDYKYVTILVLGAVTFQALFLGIFVAMLIHKTNKKIKSED